MHACYVSWNDSAISMILSLYTYLAQFILFVYTFVCISDLSGFFACIIIISFALFSNTTYPEYAVRAHMGRYVMILSIIYQFPTFAVCSLSYLMRSLFHPCGVWPLFMIIFQGAWGVPLLMAQSSLPWGTICLELALGLCWMGVLSTLSWHLLLSNAHVCFCAVYGWNTVPAQLILPLCKCPHHPILF